MPSLHSTPRFALLLTLFILLACGLPAFAQAPVVLAVDPPTNSTVKALTFIDVEFDVNVTGVNAVDLVINGVPANNVLVVSPKEYVFYFPPQPNGPVAVSWAANHGITDTSTQGNPFAGEGWSYVQDPNALPATLIISEFLANNNAGIKDDFGAREDWIEIYNPGPNDASLAGYYLTDTATNLASWALPAVPLAAGKYLIVWASGRNRTDPSLPLHTSFKLGKDGGYLALVNPATNVVSAFAPYPVQTADVSYGRDRVDPNILGFFATPTPGGQNVIGGPTVTPAPVLSVPGGVYTNSTLTLAIAVPIGTVRYTLDASLPTSNSPVYTGPITFGTNLVVKARAFPPANSGLLPSEVVAESYLMLDPAVANFSSTLPILVINTDGAAIASDVLSGAARREGTLTVIDTFRGRSSLQGAPDFHGLAGYEIFGQTSAGFDQKPFRIEVHDALGNDRKVSLLGLPAESDFKLRSTFDDKTHPIGIHLIQKLCPSLQEVSALTRDKSSCFPI